MTKREPLNRYYADEEVPLGSVTHLRSKRFPIIHAYEKGATGFRIMDIHQLKGAIKLKRVLLTLDKDFWSKKKNLLYRHFGLIVLSPPSTTPTEVNKLAEKALERLKNTDLKNSTLLVSRVKIRRWCKGKKDEIPWRKK